MLTPFLIEISPLLTFSMPAIIFKRVLFPLPFAPISATFSPLFTV